MTISEGDTGIRRRLPLATHRVACWPTRAARKQVHFQLNLKARIEVARWPFTADLANVATARHALVIDERRRPFSEYRFESEAVAVSEGRFQELWFAGVHGDVGGQNRDDDRLPDIAFSWMVRNAFAQGLAVNAKRYRHLVGVDFDDDLPADRALGVILLNSRWWWLAGGWHLRPIWPNDEPYPSVRYRIEATKGKPTPYRPKNLPKRFGGVSPD